MSGKLNPLMDQKVVEALNLFLFFVFVLSLSLSLLFLTFSVTFSPCLSSSPSVSELAYLCPAGSGAVVGALVLAVLVVLLLLFHLSTLSEI